MQMSIVVKVIAVVLIAKSDDLKSLNSVMTKTQTLDDSDQVL
jgi:hypothetical protein